MRINALWDLILLGIVFWAAWSLRFFGVADVGLISVVAGVGAGALLLAIRKENWQTIGLKSGGNLGWTLARAGEFAVLSIVVGGLGIGIATAIGHPPTTSSVITNQPETLPGFLLDIMFGVWVGSALGEEIFVRGFLLSKFRTLFGGGRMALGLAIVAQAIWFGAGHAGQGLSGMIVTGSIGLVLAIFFVTRARGSLIPMILGHGFVNTVALTIAFLT